jgi:hypothetical protein
MCSYFNLQVNERVSFNNCTLMYIHLLTDVHRFHQIVYFKSTFQNTRQNKLFIFSFLEKFLNCQKSWGTKFGKSKLEKSFLIAPFTTFFRIRFYVLFGTLLLYTSRRIQNTIVHIYVVACFYIRKVENFTIPLPRFTSCVDL